MLHYWAVRAQKQVVFPFLDVKRKEKNKRLMPGCDLVALNEFKQAFAAIWTDYEGRNFLVKSLQHLPSRTNLRAVRSKSVWEVITFMGPRQKLARSFNLAHKKILQHTKVTKIKLLPSNHPYNLLYNLSRGRAAPSLFAAYKEGVHPKILTIQKTFKRPFGLAKNTI